jgi:SAM-dependent methyltransferase
MVGAGARTFAPLIAQGRLNLLRADVTDMPLRDGIVDAICTTNTIYFWPDLPKALAELLRLLAPYGRLAVGYTGAAKMRRFDAITSHGFRLFEPPELERALKAAGFRRIATTALTGKVTEGDYVTVAHA